MQKITQQIQQYTSEFPEEMLFKKEMLALLEKKEEKAFLRGSLEAHFTASAWLIDQEMKRVLLLKHTKLDKWLQAGGHADGETDLEQVARKEAREETNLKNLFLHSESIFDIDIHTIPERNEVKEHLHYDVRFAYWVQDASKTKINSESKQFVWLSIEEAESITTNPSILRMLKKTKELI